MAYNEKKTLMKGIIMTQRQRDNRILLLKWETQFVALCCIADLKKRNQNK